MLAFIGSPEVRHIRLRLAARFLVTCLPRSYGAARSDIVDAPPQLVPAEVCLARDERRENFLWWTKISSRWADCDAYGHVNNATYYSWFDTALTLMAIERGILRAPGQTSIGLCIASECQFLAPVGFPETVD